MSAGAARRRGQGPVYLERVRLRFEWETQRVVAVNARGEVLAAESLSRLIVQRYVDEIRERRIVLGAAAAVETGHFRGGDLEELGAEVHALRRSVIAEAHRRGLPSPRGWVRRLSGKVFD